MKIKIEFQNVKKSFRTSMIIKKVVKKALKMYGVGYHVNIYILICNDKYIKQINLEHRKIDKVTDVLSFPMINWSEPVKWDKLKMGEDINPTTGEVQLGDIVLSMDRALAQADEYDHSTQREISYLCLHGLLHLLGYDHETQQDKAIMREQENQVLDSLNIVR